MAIDVFLPVSPVPSDMYASNALPFTAFGQYGEGMFDVRVFEQDIYWVNAQGEPFYLKDLDVEHVSNIISFLIEFAPEQYFAYVNYAFNYAVSISYKDSLRSLFCEDGKTIKTCNAWLSDTPLFKRLVELGFEHQL